MRKDLGGQDQAVDVVAAVLPVFAAVSLKSVKFHCVEIGIANSGEGQTDLDEGAPTGLNHGFAGVELHLLGLGEPVHSSKDSIQLHRWVFKSRCRRDLADGPL